MVDTAVAPAPDVTDLLVKIDQWGRDRNIIGAGKSQAQFLKLVEEFSEYAEHDSAAAARDGIGDTVVVLAMIAGIEGLRIQEELPSLCSEKSFFETILVVFGHLGAAIARNDTKKIQDNINVLMALLARAAEIADVVFLDCVAEAYDEIKDRKGVLLDGIFIKSTDPKYADALTRLGRSE
jgi:hypothetical protein